MGFRIVESLEVKLEKRVRILKEVFVGCDISNSEEDGFGAQILKIKMIVNKRPKTIAYIEYDAGREYPKDEFHVMYRRLEPLVAVAMDRFEETDVARLERHTPDIIAIAHYEVDKNAKREIIETEEFGGRLDACLNILRSIEDNGS
jgi:hypothetical protein